MSTESRFGDSDQRARVANAFRVNTLDWQWCKHNNIQTEKLQETSIMLQPASWPQWPDWPTLCANLSHLCTQRTDASCVSILSDFCIALALLPTFSHRAPDQLLIQFTRDLSGSCLSSKHHTLNHLQLARLLDREPLWSNCPSNHCIADRFIRDLCATCNHCGWDGFTFA